MSQLPKTPTKDAASATWTGELPDRWQLRPAKSVFKERKEKSRPDDAHLTPSQAFGVLPQAEYMERTGNRVVLHLSGSDQMRHVEPGDFVSHLRSFQGGLEYSDLAGKVSAAYTVLTPRQPISSTYFKFLFKSASYIQGLQTTTDQLRDGQSIRYSQFALLPLPIPAIQEQRAIAEFLNCETAEIDAFIRDQEELIALLRERRAATISHAVTKGLNPNAPMKNSGIQSVGVLPSHWVVGPVKRFLSSVDSQRIPLSAEQRSGMVGRFPYYGASGVIDHVNDFLFSESLVLVSEDGANLLLRNKPIAFVARGRYWVNNHAHVLRPGGNHRFWAERIEAVDVAGRVTGAAQPKLTIEALMNLQISAPDTAAERAEIECLVAREAAEFDAAIADAREAIALSRERRSALISAAVTGKIDVSEHVRGA